MRLYNILDFTFEWIYILLGIILPIFTMMTVLFYYGMSFQYFLIGFCCMMFLIRFIENIKFVNRNKAEVAE